MSDKMKKGSGVQISKLAGQAASNDHLAAAANFEI
jgi:hypothetical protein